MSDIDERVVSMQFDNKNFEQNASTTMGSLDKLNKSLQFPEGKQGLSDLADSVGKFNLGNMGSAIEGVSTKFLGMATIAITAISNITNKAVDAGIQMAKSLTISPVSGGFKEYEQGLTAFQTIVANTKSAGTSVDQVNQSLADMNDYANKTIYSFGDMTKAIGLFTAQGVSLKDSATGIKGIFNLVSLTGGDADKANGAVYQLSQAVASGTVKAQDWISVVNAGIGGTDFQNQLKATARQHGIAVDQMIKADGSFKDSLKEGWLSSQVLLETLNKYTGDLSVQQLKSMGYSAQQAQQMYDLGQTALSSATKMKTFTQLMDTLRSNVVTGWATTFKSLFGNLDEAAVLWTKVGTAVGNTLQASSDARNNLLNSWKTLGGRDKLIDGLTNAVKALGAVVKPIKDAFNYIFPPKTALQLFNATVAFDNFTKKLILNQASITKLTKIFKGIFGLLQIGWTILKQTIRLFVDLFKDIGKALSGPGAGLFDWLANLGDKLKTLDDHLVNGGGIKKFFDQIEKYILLGADYISKFVSKIAEIVAASKTLQDAIATIKDFGSSSYDAVKNFHGFDSVPGVLGAVAKSISDFASNFHGFDGIPATLDKVWIKIKDFFSTLGSKIAGAIRPSDFGSASDAVNVGLLGGILLGIHKFLGKLDGLSGAKDLIEKISGTFDQLTGTLQSMQQKVKAEIIEKIAIAVGVLTVSMIALSFVDPNKLAAALTAMAAGFGELVTTMKLLDQVASNSKDAAKIGILAGAMLAIATALDVLAIAVTIFAHTDPKDLAKGIGAITVLLGELVATIKLISGDSEGVLTASVSMIAMATAMSIMAGAVKLFSLMSWEQIGKGLAGIAGALVVVVGAMNLMPKEGMIGAGIGMLAISTALVILAKAVGMFAAIKMGDLAKGIGAIGASLLVIANAMLLMPADLPLTAAGMILLGGALLIIAKAVEMMGAIKMGTLAKGLGAIAAVLLILVIAMNAMSGAVLGAAATVIAAEALSILADVLEKLGKLKITEIITALAAIAGVFIVLGVAALVMEPIIPALIGLGVALTLVGAGFALFGAGAFLMAKAFEEISKASDAGVKAVINILKQLIAALPDIIIGFVKQIGSLGEALLKAAPPLIEALVKILVLLLEGIVKLVPPLAEALAKFVPAALKLIRDLFPDVLKTAFDLVIQLIRGIAKNVDPLVSAAVDLLVQFCKALADNAGKIVDAGVNLIVSFLESLTGSVDQIIQAGTDLIVSFILGMANAQLQLIEAGTQAIIEFLQGIANSIGQIVDAGANILIQLLAGITNNVLKVADAVTTIVITFITTMTANAILFANAGTDALVALLGAISGDSATIIEAITILVATMVTQLGSSSAQLANAGTDALISFLGGLEHNSQKIVDSAFNLITQFLGAILADTLRLTNTAAQMLIQFLNGLADSIDKYSPQLQDAGVRVAVALINGMTGGLLDNATQVFDTLKKICSDGVKQVEHFFGIGSPSKVFHEIGSNLMIGLANGISANGDKPVNLLTDVSNNVLDAFQATLGRIPDALMNMSDFNPTITPVLDLSQVQMESKKLPGFLSVSDIVPSVSLGQANIISSSTQTPAGQPDTTTPDPVPQTIKFEQNNYSPTALSTNDIYRATKSQIVLAKEKLGIS